MVKVKNIGPTLYLKLFISKKLIRNNDLIIIFIWWWIDITFIILIIIFNTNRWLWCWLIWVAYASSVADVSSLNFLVFSRLVRSDDSSNDNFGRPLFFLLLSPTLLLQLANETVVSNHFLFFNSKIFRSLWHLAHLILN